MNFFEKLFNAPKQPNEDEVIEKLDGLKRDVLRACKGNYLNEEGVEGFGAFELSGDWWDLVKKDPAGVRAFEKELADANKGKLPAWYHNLSLHRRVVEPLRELNADFQGLRDQRQRQIDSPIGGDREVTEEVDSWYQRVHGIDQRSKIKKLEQAFRALDSELNLKQITEEEYRKGVEKLEKEHQRLQAEFDISDTTLKELWNNNQIERTKDQFDFLVNDWIDSLRDTDGQIHPEIAGIIAANFATKNLRGLFEKTRNPGAVGLNSAIRGWTLWDGSTPETQKNIEELEKKITAWQDGHADNLEFAMSDERQGMSKKIETLKTLLADTLPQSLR